LALYISPNSLNPILGTSTGEAMLTALVNDPLVTLDPKGNEVPVLAAQVPTITNGGISKNGLTVTYHLRKNVKWHDGAPFSSEDVKFSWEAVMNPANNVVSKRGYDQVSSVDTPTAETVVFHLKKPFAPFVDTVFSESDSPYQVIPKHLLAKYKNMNQIPFNSEPIGTGPFKFAKWVRGDRIEFVANPDYFLGKPKLDRIIAKIIPDANTEATQIRDHEIDFLPELPGLQYRDLRNAPDVVITSVESPQWEGIAYNMSRPPLNDPLVRAALSYGVDKKKIMDETQFGAATVATESIPSYSWAYNPNVIRYDYNPEKSKQLLEQAGWKMGPNGIRVKNGQPLSLQFIVAQGSSAAQTIATLAQAQLKPLGVETVMKTYSYTMLYATVAMGGILNGGKYDIAIYAWVYGGDPDDSSSFLCDYIPPAGNNIFHLCNKDFDRAEADALAHPDRATRKAAYARAQAIMAKENPANFLFYRKQLHASNPDFKGFTPNGITPSWNAYQWSI
ncbi:MAG: peptide ABC transporter substrate-binding protein, partial [Candidatus Eremiobacteraeota bacterium]|nr:peptide ABC transporter substrate-binding protein [Candidatus Eremiobacteraeota bacterium]